MNNIVTTPSITTDVSYKVGDKFDIIIEADSQQQCVVMDVDQVYDLGNDTHNVILMYDGGISLPENAIHENHTN